MTYLFRLFIAADLLLLLPTPCRCQTEYELLLPDGLKQGQSLSIRPFTLNQLAPYHYSQESLQEVQKAMAISLQEALGGLGRFTRVVTISESDAADTDLILEGTFSQITQGKRPRMATPLTKAGTATITYRETMRISGVFKRVVGNETVLWVHCTSDQLSSALFVLSTQVRAVEGGVALYLSQGAIPMHECARQISKDMAKTIKEAEQKPASGKPVTKW